MFPWPLESQQTVQAPCFVILGRSGHYFAWIIVQILGPLLTMKVMMPVLSLSCLSFIVAVYSQKLTLSVPIHYPPIFTSYIYKIPSLYDPSLLFTPCMARSAKQEEVKNYKKHECYELLVLIVNMSPRKGLTAS